MLTTLVLFISLITYVSSKESFDCSKYVSNYATCVRNGCVYCIEDKTDRSGWCMSEDFYRGLECNTTCCSVVERSSPDYAVGVVWLCVIASFGGAVIIAIFAWCYLSHRSKEVDTIEA